MCDPKDWVAVAALPDLGAASLKRLWDHGWTPEKLLGAACTDLQRLGLKHTTLNALLDYQSGCDGVVKSRVDKALAWQRSESAAFIVSITDERYPLLLRELADPPPILFVKGNPECLNLPQIGVVGSRNASVTGVRQAAAISDYLGEHGLCINSGLALGIDAAAHQASVDKQKPTIAVFGTGVDRVYPGTNKTLADQIIENNGAWVSEFFPGSAPYAANFPRRNRIISGMSLGILVVEAALRSGSLITARMAMEQNREVFAIPGPLNNPLSKGCHQLIREGAVLVEAGMDIVREIGGLLGVLAESAEMQVDESNYQLEPDLQRVLASMGFELMTADQISNHSGIGIAKLSSMLVELELKGLINQTPMGYVRL
ncbi:MAG: DNA-protecting protein DprA [Neptuniibacter caesariensis]|uniref:DNA-protecting protein DprA n=1 Tax=Neptuniibacter caesariensis TaxID=207954 RepID=A0A2G6JAH4_NEPCE|nr:MAG: DNA-protecting protein DprA [Neptuniibacter caesariensis]